MSADILSSHDARHRLKEANAGRADASFILFRCAFADSLGLTEAAFGLHYETFLAGARVRPRSDKQKTMTRCARPCSPGGKVYQQMKKIADSITSLIEGSVVAYITERGFIVACKGLARVSFPK